jgi:uncharacterized protein (TIGR03435 family)
MLELRKVSKRFVGILAVAPAAFWGRSPAGRSRGLDSYGEAGWEIQSDGGEVPHHRRRRRRNRDKGGPGWISSERYTISAKAEGNANAYMMQGPLLQTMLESRFKLKMHRETREVPIYELVVAKGGPKLKRFQQGSCTPMPPIDFTKIPDRPSPLPAGQHYCQMGGGAAGPNLVMHFQEISLDDFANTFPGDRPVVNKTGVQGVFEINLEFGLTDESRQQLNDLTGTDPGEPTRPPALRPFRNNSASSWNRRKGRASSLWSITLSGPTRIWLAVAVISREVLSLPGAGALSTLQIATSPSGGSPVSGQIQVVGFSRQIHSHTERRQ